LRQPGVFEKEQIRKSEGTQQGRLYSKDELDHASTERGKRVAKRDGRYTRSEFVTALTARAS